MTAYIYIVFDCMWVFAPGSTFFRFLSLSCVVYVRFCIVDAVAAVMFVLREATDINLPVCVNCEKSIGGRKKEREKHAHTKIWNV